MDITIAQAKALTRRLTVTASIPIDTDDIGGRQLAGRVIDRLCDLGSEVCRREGRSVSITWLLDPLGD